MRDFSRIFKNSLMRLATVLTTLMVGMTFAMIASTASAGEINKVEVKKAEVNKVEVNKVEVVKPMVVEKVMPPVENPRVKVDSSSDFVRPFGFGFGFNPFFDEEFFGFGD